MISGIGFAIGFVVGFVGGEFFGEGELEFVENSVSRETLDVSGDDCDIAASLVGAVKKVSV